MIVSISQELFVDLGEKEPLVIRLIGLGHRRRHKIRTRPAFRESGDTAFHVWLRDQSPAVREDLILALTAGLTEYDYAIPNRERLPVVEIAHVGEPFWPDSFEQGPAVLPLTEETLQFVEKPLELFLENRRNDTSFLSACAPSTWKSRFDLAVKNGFIERRHAGGIGEMRMQIEEDYTSGSLHRLRTWALFDHDGETADEPSKASGLLGETLDAIGIPHHRLRRRAIENYIPIGGLYRWANAAGSVHERKKRLARCGSHKSLAPASRHFVAMKSRDRFGPSIGDVWGDGRHWLRADELAKDGSEEEHLAIMQSLFASL